MSRDIPQSDRVTAQSQDHMKYGYYNKIYLPNISCPGSEVSHFEKCVSAKKKVFETYFGIFVKMEPAAGLHFRNHKGGPGKKNRDVANKAWS